MSSILADGKYTLGEINVGLSVAMAAMLPIPGALNLMLMGQFGLVPLSLDFKAQLNAALSVGLSWNPLLTIKGALDMVAALQANLIPQLSINASAVADISLKLGGIQLMIDLGLKISLPVANFVAGMGANLSMPGIAYVAWEGTPGEITQVTDTLKGHLKATPGQTVYCIALAATDVQFKSAAGMMFMM